MTGRHPKFYKRAAAVAELHSLGCTNRRARELLRLDYVQIADVCRHAGIKLANDTAGWAAEHRKSKARAAEMAELYKAGYTLEAIGQQYRLTRERVRQLMTKHLGLRAKDGGQAVRAQKNADRRQRRKDIQCLKKYGCTYAQYIGLRDLGHEMRKAGIGAYRTPLYAYRSQERNAHARGIAWELDLWSWWTVWQDSGHWEERGRAGDAYVMCRLGDTGPYAIGNVYIATLRHNSTVQLNNPYRLGHPDHAATVSRRVANARANRDPNADLHTKHTGLPRGVTRHKGSGRFMAQAKGKYLGMFGTVEEAHGAYLAAVPVSATLEQAA